jgi:ABC-type transport system involved in Fe-S cluster assembly, permease component
MNVVVKKLLDIVSGIKDKPNGAYNIRVDGKSIGHSNSDNIKFIFKEGGKGIEIRVKANTKNESVHIPAIIERDDFTEVVYNDFYIGDDCDITIIAGCGVHNDGHQLAQHDGIHTFHVGKNSTVKYIEKHYGEGNGTGERIINPDTIVYLDNGGTLEMDTIQIEGVDSTKKNTAGTLNDNSTLIVREKLMTSGHQYAYTGYQIDLNGYESNTHLVSRSVAKDHSIQEFIANINGNNKCMGHSECDGIIMENARIKAVPEINANHVDASLIHEAAIGKIAGEQITKLMTLGLTSEQAEAEIINGFLK